MLMNFWCIVHFLLILLSRQESLAKRKGYNGLRRGNGNEEEGITFQDMSDELLANNENDDVKGNLTDAIILEHSHPVTVTPTILHQWILWLIFTTSFSLALSVSVISLCIYHRYLNKFKDTNNNNIQVDNYVKCPQRKWNPADRSSNSLAPERYIHRYETKNDKKDFVKLFSIKSDDDTDTTDEETIIFDIDNIP